MKAVLAQTAPLPLSGAWFAAERDPGHRIVPFLVLSALLHALLLSLHFTHDPRTQADTGTRPLQVVLVNAKSPTRPTDAKLLAQANLEGGGNTEQKLVATSPFPAHRDTEPQPELKQKLAKLQEMERQQQALLTQLRASPSLPLPASENVPQEHSGARPDAHDLIQRSLEMARLQAQIERQYQAYQERPKRRFVGARAEEYRFARYVEDWRIKVERVGNLNYPEEARQKKLYGSLLLTVHLRADGSVERVEVDRSSGSRILDEAAQRIVQLASPFAPFPEDIRRDTDILAITRTWTFTRQDQLTSQ